MFLELAMNERPLERHEIGSRGLSLLHADHALAFHFAPVSVLKNPMSKFQTPSRFWSKANRASLISKML